MSNRYANRHEFFAAIDDAVQRVLAEQGVEEALRQQCGAAVADGLSYEYAGSEIYVPQDFGYKLSLREIEILNRHRNGAQLQELQREFEMTRSGLQRLIKRARTRDPHWDQGNLFGQ
jgi:Mor family transcriptional regulator